MDPESSSGGGSVSVQRVMKSSESTKELMDVVKFNSGEIAQGGVGGSEPYGLPGKYSANERSDSMPSSVSTESESI